MPNSRNKALYAKIRYPISIKQVLKPHNQRIPSSISLTIVTPLASFPHHVAGKAHDPPTPKAI